MPVCRRKKKKWIAPLLNTCNGYRVLTIKLNLNLRTCKRNEKSVSSRDTVSETYNINKQTIKKTIYTYNKIKKERKKKKKKKLKKLYKQTN